jgi:polygalacturonase
MQKRKPGQPHRKWKDAARKAKQPRTMPDRLKEVVNVRDFGAVGDGRPEDAAAVQMAADHAGGDVLYFPPGVYSVAAPLVLGRKKR